MRWSIVYIALLGGLVTASALAAEPKDMPYYASLKSDEANIRTGPNVKYPIRWVYKRKDWPVVVTATFEGWRKVSDINGEAGWVHETLINRRRHVVVKADGVQEVYRLPVKTATVTMLVENGVVANLIQCKSNWCKIEVGDIKGWIRSENLWGINDNEVVG